MTPTAVYALTDPGARLGSVLADRLGGDLFLPARLADEHGAVAFDRLVETVSKNYSQYSRHVFIAAAGIVVRAVAPHLTSKDRDPAVVLLDQEGRHCISLLSGHLGGANALARKVACITGGDAVITTATDTAGLPSMDLMAREKGLKIANLEAVKTVNMAMLAGEAVQVFDPGNFLGFKTWTDPGAAFVLRDEAAQWDKTSTGVWVTWRKKSLENALVLYPRCLIAGMGCNRGTSCREILDLITGTFARHDLDLESLKCLATIDSKYNEQGLVVAARELGVPLILTGPGKIQSIDVPHPSGVVEKHMGVPSVCEATAILNSGMGKLLVPKTKSRNVTLAVALAG